MLNWTKTLAVLIAAAVLAAPASALANDAAPTTNLVQDYAQREAQAADLEQFTGGWHGVVLTVVVAALLIWLVWELFDRDDDGQVERHEAPHVHP